MIFDITRFRKFINIFVNLHFIRQSEQVYVVLQSDSGGYK
jgi:hypothetical protein